MSPDRDAREARTVAETLTARSHATAVFYAGPEARPVAYGTDVSGEPRVFVRADGAHARLETTWSIAQARELFNAIGAVLLAAEIEADQIAGSFDAAHALADCLDNADGAP